MSASTIEQASLLTGRQLVMGAVIGLHALAIASLMAMRIPLEEKSPEGFKPISQVAPVEPVPPAPAPKLVPADRAVALFLPQLPGPVIGLREAPQVPVDAGPAVVPLTEPAAEQPGAAAVNPATALQWRAVRTPDDYYPAASVQLQEEGAAIVHVCVAPGGQMEGAPVVTRTSGSRRLDAAAVKWAGEALTFTPATRSGTAVSACRDFRVTFSLR